MLKQNTREEGERLLWQPNERRDATLTGIISIRSTWRPIVREGLFPGSQWEIHTKVLPCSKSRRFARESSAREEETKRENVRSADLGISLRSEISGKRVLIRATTM